MVISPAIKWWIFPVRYVETFLPGRVSRRVDRGEKNNSLRVNHSHQVEEVPCEDVDEV